VRRAVGGHDGFRSAFLVRLRFRAHGDPRVDPGTDGLAPGRGASVAWGVPARPPHVTLALAPPPDYTEPYGSVFTSPTGCLVRRARGPHPARHSRAAGAWGRFDHRPCEAVPHDPHGHEEARRGPGAGGARHHGKGRARPDVQARLAPAG